MAFIWTKMHTESGISLSAIIRLKEAERQAGNGRFWWGIGNALDPIIVREAAQAANGRLPILFSRMLAQPKPKDINPEQVLVWTAGVDTTNKEFNLPSHVLEFSRGHVRKKQHYALVCHSSIPLVVGDHGPFDPKHCQQEKSGKSPDARQVTTLLRGSNDEVHMGGRYREGFRATLVDPWFVNLVKHRQLDRNEIGRLESWNEKEEWKEFVDQLRGGNSL